MTTNIFGQEIAEYNFDIDIEVTKDGDILNSAWAGGLNFIQIETFDFNNDNIDDLLVFDRSGNRIMPFIKQSSEKIIDYKYFPDYAINFPPVQNWIKLIDYNCDGKKDIFAYNKLGIEVWKNTSSESVLEFEQIIFEYNTPNGILYKEAIKTDIGSEYDVNLSIIYQDIPAIADINSDGSIDILNFGLGSAIPEGSTVEYHENRSPCGLDFALQSVCWGGFAENYMNNSVTLSVCSNSLSKRKEIKMHAGSSLLVHDFNGNGLPDMLIGDITFENATLVFNNGSIANAQMTEMDDNFPNYSTPIDIEYFPGFSMIDIEHDGKEDLIASPAIKGSMNSNSVWWYKNTSNNGNTHFELQSKSFLQDEMIDVGEGSNPHLFDIDGDGLLDLLIGNYGYYKDGGGYISKIAFYKNTGNINKAKFELKSDNYGKFDQFNKLNIYPAFGDLNDDEIPDVIIGESEGMIHYFEGIGNGDFNIKQFNYLGIDVGNGAMPNLTDVDEDGLLDLIIGNKKGKLSFFLNTGDKGNPSFELISDNWGNIDLSGIDVQGAWLSSSIMNHPKSGKLLILGTQTGTTYAYKNISTSQDATFELFSDNYLNYDEGERATVTTGDLNNDTYPDIIIGNMSGGLRLAIDATQIIKHKNKLVVYPNPVIRGNYLYIKYRNNFNDIDIFDISGRRMKVKVLEDKIDISNLNNGIYIIIEKTESDIISTKFIISR
ncbi:MAG: T9SS type A sorting domain-containing protein [Bacteroidota bacterium]